MCVLCNTKVTNCATCKFNIDSGANGSAMCLTCVPFVVDPIKLRTYYILSSTLTCIACPDYCFACK